MHDRYEESVALLHKDSVTNEEEEALHASPSRSAFKLSQWVILTLLSLTVIDVAASLYVVRLLMSTPGSDTDALEVRSQYVGLDELYASGVVNASRHSPIVNMPRLAAQVSSTEPRKVSPEDQHRHLTDFGTLSPPDRHLQVSRKMHTVLQFRVMDYGMERCSLALRLPPPGAGLLVSGNDNSTTRLDVYKLDSPRFLEARTLSWSSRPRRLKLMGTMEANAGDETRLPDFSCSCGSLHTYEVECASDSPQCDIDVWSHKHSPYGILMYQFQTV